MMVTGGSMAEDRRAEDCKMGDPGPSQETTVRSSVAGVTSWGIESEIAHSSEIK